MAERTVFWKIVSDFTKARRDTDRYADSIRRLREERERSNETSSDGSAERAERGRNNALREGVRLAQQANSRRRESVSTTREATAAATAQARSNESLALAEQRVTQATLSQKKATLELTAAQQRLAAVTTQYGEGSQRHAAALMSVERKMVAVESATHRYNRALGGLSAAQNALDGSSRNTEGRLLRIGNGFKNFASGVMRFPSGVLKGIGMALLPIMAIGAALLPLLGGLVTGIGALAAGAVSLIGPLGGMANAMAALPQGAMVAAGAIGTLIGAFSGLGDALKAGMKQQQEGGKAARDFARQEEAAARGIIMAQRALRNAREQQRESLRNYSRAIKDAARAVKDAKEAEISASKDLSEARKQARRDLQDMQASLRDLALAERGAAISVEEARRRLQSVLMDPGSDELSKQQAQLAYDEAVARMDDVKKQKKRADKDSAEAFKKGVNGHDAVVAAQKAEADATRNLARAQRDLNDTRRDAAKSARDSAEAVADAQYNLAQAYKTANDTMSSGSSTMSAYNDAMEKLSPAGRNFVLLLMSMQDQVKRLRWAAQEGLLPGLGEALVELTKLLPIAERGLFSFGQIMADTAKRGATMLTSPEFMPMWNRLLESNKRLLALSGDAMLNLLEAMVYLMDAAAPFTEWLAETVTGWTDYWKTIAKAGNETGDTAAALDRTKETLQIMGRIIKNVWKTFRGFAKAGRKDGIGLLKGLENITEEWSKWSNSEKGRKELSQWFRSMRKPLSAFSELLGAITRGLFDMSADPENSKNVADMIDKIREMGPAVKDLLTNLSGEFGTELLDFVKNLLEIFADLTEGGGGGLTSFVETLNIFAEVLQKITSNTAGLALVQGLGTALGIIAALKFTGVLALFKGVGKVAKGGKGAVGKVRAFATTAPAGGAVGVAGSRRGGARPTTYFRGSGDEGGRRRAGGGARRARRTRDERGSVSMYGGFGNSGGARREDRRTRRAEARRDRRGASGGGGARRASGGGARRADSGGIGKAGKAMGKVGGAATGLSLVLSFLPGKIGEIANKFLMLSMVFSVIAPLIKGLGGIFLKVVTMIGGSLFKMVGIVVRALGMISKVMMMNPWMLLVLALIIVVTLVVKYWDEIKAAIKKAIDWVIKFVKKNWNIIKWFMGPLGLLIDLVVKNWDKIKKVFVKAIDAIVAFVKKVWSKFKDIFIEPVKAGWNAMRPLWDKIKKHFSDGADKIKTTFQRLKEGIKNTWDKIKSVLAKPVEFAINTVINDWLIGNVNKLLGKIGLSDKQITPMPEVHFARGGQVPGQGNRDSIPARLMPGEFVLRKDAVRSIGVSRLHAMNEGYTHRGSDVQKFGFGDIVNGAKNAGKSAFAGVRGAARKTWGTVTDVGGRAINLAKTGAAEGLNMLLRPLRSRLAEMKDVWVLDDVVKSIGNRLFDTAISWIGAAKPKKKDEPTHYATGGQAKSVSALLTPGEFVFDRDSVSRIGISNLRKMNRSGGGGGRAMERFAKGGQVRKRKRLREGIDGDAGYKGTPLKFATGGIVPGDRSPFPNPSDKSKVRLGRILKFLRDSEVKEKTYTGRRKIEKRTKVRDFLTDAYNVKRPGRTLLHKFLSANGLLQKTIKGTKGGDSKALTRALSFARGQSGKPYVWGGVGPGGYDCSGYQSAITNVIKGNNPYSRLFATGSMSSALPRLGFRPGLGGPNDFSVGWFTGSPGHTGGTLGTLAVESTGNHVRNGSAARGAGHSMFNHRAHLPLGSTKGTPDRKTGKKYTLDSFLKAGRYKVPGLEKLVGAKSWMDVRQEFGLSAQALYDLVSPQIAKIRDMKGRKGEKFMEGFRRVAAKQKGTTPDPDKKKTPGEIYLDGITNETARQKAWVDALSQLSIWGFPRLVEDLLTKGIDGEGAIQTAIEASKSFSLAERLEDALTARGNVTSEDLANIMKTIAYVSSSQQDVGLRDLARHLQLSDYQTVMMVEEALKTSHFDKIKPRMGKLNSDISAYRSGIFYANTGGQVPGTGSSDTVPAMLTPGEFVVKKKAAKALGLNNLMALNNIQHLNSGGPVLAPSMPSIPTRAVDGISARAMRAGGAAMGGTTTIYDVDINNPVAEPGTRSMMKALQRQTALGGRGSSVKKGG